MMLKTSFRCIFCNTLHRNYSGKSVRKLEQDVTSNTEIKKQNAKILRRYNEENKSLFGSLVETLPQKRDREKDEPFHAEVQEESSSIKNDRSAEAWWWKNSLVRTTCQISEHRTGISTVLKFQESNKTEDIGDANNSDDERVSESDGYLSNKEKCEILKRNDDKKDNPIIFHKSNIRLPHIIVKNLTSFPLDQENKQLSRKPLSSPILSIPMKAEKDSGNNQYLEYPSVSKILNATMSDSSRAALQRWKENLIAELGEEGFLKYQTMLLQHGRMFHDTVQKHLSGVSHEEICVNPAVEGSWHSLEATLKEISNVKALESHVVHKQLLYHGIIDCVADYKGKTVLIEWKKSNKKKTSISNTYDAPLQAAAYLGAMNFDVNYDLRVHECVVVVAYTDGSPANIHFLSKTECQKYWYFWLKRLQLYWNLFNKQDMINNVTNIIS